MSKKREVLRGTASLTGTLTCATIAAELLTDELEGTQHFPLSGPARWCCILVFGLFACLEARKVQKRLTNLLD